MRCLYTFFVRFYALLICMAAMLGHDKARKWYKGRKQPWHGFDPHEKIIWMHVSSLGEFEQGRPLLERLKQDFPRYKILLTFFSPSGYEVRRNFSLADRIMYLPVDTPGNAKKFLDFFRPTVCIFVKYDFWFNFLREIFRRNLPIFFISVHFRSRQYFFKWYGRWALGHLRKVTLFFAQREETCLLLKKHGITQCIVAGDTRFDRVISVAIQDKRFPVLEKFASEHLVYVAGSTWFEDEKYIARAVSWFPHMKFIVVPHEVSEDRLRQIEKLMPIKSIRFSSIDQDVVVDHYRILIIDQIGILSALYRYANIAHVGNGFGSGIHNILEAAVYGVPVIFGPNYRKFSEAIELIERGGAFSFSNPEEYKKIIKFLLDEKVRQQIKNICSTYVYSMAGATERIMRIISSYL
ncbi:MAG: 3-deoxy-D-manno-octulosonic acid transferase [Bacteroidales bacterium]|nr:3-deoxy-D-manno-octulosonic acid transferase [Bacteroidales bacterium]